MGVASLSSEPARRSSLEVGAGFSSPIVLMRARDAMRIYRRAL